MEYFSATAGSVLEGVRMNEPFWLGVLLGITGTVVLGAIFFLIVGWFIGFAEE